MPDREKVIKDLEECLSASCRGFRPRLSCPYNDDEWGIMRDALAMLKEQDVKPMIENEIGWNCPSCGMNLIGKTASGYPCDLIDLPEDEPIHFCPKCGQAVKWE